MMSMMNKFSMKPRELKRMCENEHWSHKARIVGFSVFMASIAGYYQYYFDMMAYRSTQYQNAALAGEAGFAFMDYADTYWTGAGWALKQTKDAWDDKSLKTLK